MKPFNLKRKSWHYKCATFANSSIKYVDEIDFCSYLPAVMFGAFLITGLSIIAAGLCVFAVWGVADLLAWLCFVVVQGGTSGVVLSDVGMSVVMSVLFSGLLILVLKASTDWIPQFKEYLEKERESENPSFLGMVLKTFQDKACFKIKFD